MIKHIIKLDGTQEPFNPAKANRWCEWGTENLKDKVDWSSIVMETVQSMPETVKSQDFQMGLIENTLAHRTWSHYLFAGRLYAVWIHKHLYGTDGIPTVKALHTRMQKDRLMVKLNYTTQDYLKIESFIKHDLDFEQPHFALHQIRKKYALGNRVTGVEYESPQFTYMRMAMALAEKEPKAKRLEAVKDYYELFAYKQLSAPTPNYINLGTVHRGFASCCLFAVGDNGTSLAMGNFIGDKMTQMSAGIGVNIMTRAVGDAVRGGLFEHHGKKKYYDAMGKSIVANVQAGRGGAVTCFYEAFDQEIEMIQALRNPLTTPDRRNRDMHFAMLANRLFAKKAAKGEDIFAFNPYTAPDLHAAFYGKDPEVFETLYAKYEADPAFKKNYISARDVLRSSLLEAQETGVAYVGQIDELNRHTPFKDPIHSSNLCVAPETEILTDKGYVQIQSVAGTKQNIWNGEEWSEVDVVKTGENQKLITVRTITGKSITCTPYHKFYVTTGDIAFEEKRAGNLEVGDNLIGWTSPISGILVSGDVVTEIVDTGRTDDTYCFTEPKRNMGVFNGILTGNCMEIAEPTKPYYDMPDLFSTEDHGRGEIATCSLAAVSVENVPDSETYRKVCYYALKMIDYCILNSHYVFPHLEFTAKQRMSAGVGIMGLATHLAKNGLDYTSDAGKNEIHFIAERHMYFLIEASLKISQERGLAPWIHKTLWPEGWLPIDTYKRAVDDIKTDGTKFEYLYDWESLRTKVIANGGIGHSVLVAYMPGESSSKALGGANSIYPVRRLTLSKNDQNNHLYWAAPYGDDPNVKYQFAWDIPTKDLIDCYAIFQKFTDQGISADLYRRIVGAERIDSNELLKDYFYMVKMGMKTRYYFNTETTANLSLEAMESAVANNDGVVGCGGGSCSL